MRRYHRPSQALPAHCVGCGLPWPCPTATSLEDLTSGAGRVTYHPNVIERGIVFIVGALVTWALVTAIAMSPDARDYAAAAALIGWIALYTFGLKMREQAFTLECDTCKRQREIYERSHR